MSVSHWDAMDFESIISRFRAEMEYFNTSKCKPDFEDILGAFLLCCSAAEDCIDFDEICRERAINIVEDHFESACGNREDLYFKAVLSGKIPGADPEEKLSAYLREHDLPAKFDHEFSKMIILEHAGPLRSMPYRDFLQSPYWVLIREVIRYRGRYRCQLCNSRGALNVHHKTYEHRGYEHCFMEDLISLCRTCHSKFHDKFAEDK